MADLTSNDAWQDRGVVKLTDGSYVADITSDGEIKVKDSSNVINAGGEKHLVVDSNSINSLLGRVLKELKKMNIQLAMITDNEIKNSDLYGGD